MKTFKQLFGLTAKGPEAPFAWISEDSNIPYLQYGAEQITSTYEPVQRTGTLGRRSSYIGLLGLFFKL